MKRRILCISIIACMALGGCASQTASTSDSLRNESESTSLVEGSEPASEPSETDGGKPSADIVNYNIPYTSDRVYSIFDDAVGWKRTKYIFLEAMRAI